MWLSKDDIFELSCALSGTSHGEFIRMLEPAVQECERIYLAPLTIHAERDAKEVVRHLGDGSWGVRLGERLMPGVCTAIAEVLMNACMHADADGRVVFVGEYRDRERVFNVSVYDGGVGFCGKIAEYLGRPDLTVLESIDWALKEGNSVDKEERAAGVGLNEAVDFIRRNGGLMEIVTGDVIWRIESGVVSKCPLPYAIVGSLVNFSIKMDDTVSYRKRMDAIIPENGLEIRK